MSDVIGQDIRYALRSLAATPGFTAVAVITLALGIGANTAIFTVVESVLLRGLPYSEADQLVLLERSSTRSSVTAASWPDFHDWREQLTSFRALAGVVHFSTDIQWERGTQTDNGAAVSWDLFDLLGVAPLYGRTFTGEEDHIGGPRVVILDHENFVRHFAGDPAALGRSIVVSGEPHELIGVMPPGFAYPASENVGFWIPMRDDELLTDAGLPANARGLGFIDVIGRLAPGVTMEQADVEVREVVARIDAANAPDRAATITVRLRPLHDATVGDVRGVLLLLLGAVGVVLAIACANVANLSLSKASSRRREMAIRSALGAPRRRLVFQQVLESALLGLAGGLVGVVLAYLATAALLTIAPSWLPRAREIAVDATVLAFTVVVSIACGVLSGVLPALRSSRTRPGAALGEASRGSTHGRRGLRTHNLLVATQVALAVVLLTLAALLGNSFVRLVRVDPGFDPDNIVRAALSPPSRMEGNVDAVLGFYGELLATVRALPGVRRATLTYSPPFGRNEFTQTVVPEGDEQDPDDRHWVGTVIVGDDYFGTMGIPLLRGRDFGPEDRRGGAPVAIVNEAMAESFWPGNDAVGKRFRLTDGISGSLDSFDEEFFPDDWFTVIGVAGDVRRLALDAAPEPEFYRPQAQMAWGSQFLLVRTGDAPGNVAELIRQAIWALDSGTAINGVGTVREWMADNVAEPRFRAVLLGAFALLATSLAMVGVYAVMAWGVAQRRREIGVRMALGAPGARVRREVLRRGLLITAAGATVGLAAAVAATRFVAAALYEVSPTDPWTLGAVVGFVVIVSALACYRPARHASKVDPLVALRSP